MTHMNPYLFGLPFRGPLYSSGGYSGPSEEALREQREEERAFQIEMMERQRQNALDDAARAKREAEEEAEAAARADADERSRQEAMAQNASEAAMARGANANSSLSERETSSLAFIRRGGVQIPRPE